MARRISLNELTDAGCFAYGKLRGHAEGPKSAEWRRYLAAWGELRRRGYSERDLFRIVSAGIRELKDLGYAEGRFEEDGSFTVTVLHDELIEGALAPIILHDRQ